MQKCKSFFTNNLFSFGAPTLIIFNFRSATGNLSILKTDGIWDEKTLREYFAHIHSFRPAMTKEAERVLCATYMYHRHRPERREERTTVRLMDSLVRYVK